MTDELREKVAEQLWASGVSLLPSERETLIDRLVGLMHYYEDVDDIVALVREAGRCDRDTIPELETIRAEMSWLDKCGRNDAINMGDLSILLPAIRGLLARTKETTTDLTDKIGADLNGLGGHLECTVCGHRRPLGNIGRKLANGWPKCCGYTMRWITARQENEPVQ